MRRVFWLATVLGVAVSSGRAQGGPLPDVAVLRERAVENFKKTAGERERYTCRERLQTEQLDGKGGAKKTEVIEQESFFVHGHEIRQTLTKDGRPLSASEQKKQDEEVRKRIAEYSSGAAGNRRSSGAISIGDVLKKATLVNERRVMVSGRPTIVFDVVSDRNGKASDIAEKLLMATEGRVSIDEQTGTPQDVSLHGVRDVKVGGGMVANVHKGFYAHVLLAPQPDGVWLIQQVEGNGDARVGLFFHPSMRFQQMSEGCRLYSVWSDSVEKMPGK